MSDGGPVGYTLYMDHLRPLILRAASLNLALAGKVGVADTTALDFDNAVSSISVSVRIMNGTMKFVAHAGDLEHFSSEFDVAVITSDSAEGALGALITALGEQLAPK